MTVEQQCPEIPFFGANYPDAACIDGYLWDLDSVEEDGLTCGGDIPCPFCNTEKFLDHYGEDNTDLQKWIEEMRIKYGD